MESVFLDMIPMIPWKMFSLRRVVGVARMAAASSAVQSSINSEKLRVWKMDQACLRLQEILTAAGKQGIPPEAIVGLAAVGKLLQKKKPIFTFKLATMILVGGIALIYALNFQALLIPSGWHKHGGGQLCTIAMPDNLNKAFRPPEDCSICDGLTSVDKIASIRSKQFEEKYAYTGRPVVITDGQINWTAKEVFTFEFFKDLYGDSDSNCQFFPYKTEFTELREALNMSEARSQMKEGTIPWYIGWSNCDDSIARVLRQHYTRPYFLPVTAEGKKVDWIFMGTPGYGAQMHIDNVEFPSWQAQIQGRKIWSLEPPPECYYQCRPLEVTVEKGEIIVLDTNRWYHMTTIAPGALSITIGAEYD